MNNYKELKLSLTKFGYHKIAILLRKYESKEIFEHLNDEGDRIDIVQARKIISNYYREDESIWEFWNNVKQLGQQDINDIIFFSIIFSHSRLTNLVSDAFQNKNGLIFRVNNFITVKEYTNFARTCFELGFVVEEELERGNESFTLDVSRINYKFYLPQFIIALIKMKLIDAGAEQSIDTIEEINTGELHYCLNMSNEEFRLWTLNELDTHSFREIKRQPRNYSKGIKFKSGHNPKLDGEVSGQKTPKKYTSTLKHNRLQTKIYSLLRETYAETEIGTEVPCDSGSIDIVVKKGDVFDLYELKTSNNITSCVREALGQLMEYAYLNSKIKVDHLIIITPNEATKEIKEYFGFLREQFKISIYYQYFNETEMLLSELY